MEKKYKVGMVIGRFQPFHCGHQRVIEEALEVCNTVIVVIGSAQESRVFHNPLTAQERENMIRDCFYDELELNPNCIKFLHLADREDVSNDASWGEYVMNEIEHKFHVSPGVVFEGYESARQDWYDSLDITVVQISRNIIPISGAELRNAIWFDNRERYNEWCATGTQEWYVYLKEVLKECKRRQKQ